MDEENPYTEQKKRILLATTKGDWSEVADLLVDHPDLAKEAISRDGSTILHIAVGIGHNRIVKYLIHKLSDQDVLKKRESDGSTSLHIAAIVGNKNAAELLVKKNPMLLQTIDSNGKVPLYKAYEYMHLVTIEYLFQAISDDAKTELQSSSPDSIQPGEEIAVELLANAISAKQYRLAFVLVQRFPNVASKSDDVLMALAKTFPSGLDYAEALIYPSHDYLTTIFYTSDWITFDLLLYCLAPIEYFHRCSDNVIYKVLITIVLGAVPIMLILVLILMVIITIFVCVIFGTLYSIWWNVAKILIPPIKRIDDKQKEWDAAIQLLEDVCDKIDKLPYTAGTDHPYYTRPVLEAACHNAYKVVDEILFRSPQTIRSTDKSGHDIIQLAILNRSEKIYNLIYDLRERKNFYRKYEDSFQNNMLHLAGKLAPSSVLSQRTGAALQLQRELQWREEIKKLVVPTYITQENVFKQTPDMIFTREHEGLVKEGEKWMKTAAESCSITAALITTIVFAAAITVPGGSNQEGKPINKHRDAFVIFAISDAISLFASTTALLVFLSILTARFAEKDFLVSLPRRLFIGLFSLLLSTTAMMIAFSATLFLVFGDERSWMLAPISALAIIPVSFFVGLQFPLMVDLFRSTYIGIFGKQRKSVSRKFNLTDLQSLGTNTKRGITRALSKEESKNDLEDKQLKQTRNYVSL